ncbi:MAG: ferredoxin--NADP reductase [Rickettsiales bacterium]|nr:ferredoxin--NADP reductase [Rickettsiales bacterium]
MNVTLEKDKQKKVNSNAPTLETVLDVQHWTDSLFSFRITRPDGFRFRAGEFVMIGLNIDGQKPILRAYSMASPSWDEELEFFSIKVENGPLTSRLQKIQPGDKILLGKKPTGTLVADALTAGKRLFLLSTGTGFAPFASIIRDLDTYEKFDHVYVTHTCRKVAELGYSQKVVNDTINHEFLGDIVGGKLTYYDSITREPYEREGRITNLMKNGKLFSDLGIEGFSPETDRIMICGSNEMNLEIKDYLEELGFGMGANNAPAQYVIEKAFVG